MAPPAHPPDTQTVIIALIAVADPSKREEGQKLAKSVPFFGQIMILGRVELLWGAE